MSKLSNADYLLLNDKAMEKLGRRIASGCTSGKYRCTGGSGEFRRKNLNRRAGQKGIQLNWSERHPASFWKLRKRGIAQKLQVGLAGHARPSFLD